MPQIVVNMKVNKQDKVRRKLKNNRFKLRHAAQPTRWRALEKKISH